MTFCALRADVLPMLPYWLAHGQPDDVVKKLQNLLKCYDKRVDFPKVQVMDNSTKRSLPDFPNLKNAITCDEGLVSSQFKLLKVKNR